MIHSALVEIDLHVSGRVLSVAQLGPDFLVLRQPIELPPGPARIVLAIDGTSQTYPVWLPDGIRLAWKKVPLDPMRKS